MPPTSTSPDLQPVVSGLGMLPTSHSGVLRSTRNAVDVMGSTIARSRLALLPDDRPAPLPEPAASPIPTPSDRVTLPFDRLRCFEDVADRFADLGLRFHNAIALVPSNPGYPTLNQTLVIVSAPQNGALEIQFERPVSSLTACLTSSRPATMSARDQVGAVVARSRIASSNLCGTNATIAANHPLIVIAPAIHHVTFCAFDGQMAIGDLSFTWAL